MQEYVQDNFVKHGMIADFAIHDKNDGNPHVHILLTTRNVDKNGFGNKNRDWNNPQYLKQWRENWAKSVNTKFEQKRRAERIDHRTLKLQGIDREPQIHVGVEGYAMAEKGIITPKMQRNIGIIERNKSKSAEKTAENMSDLKQGYIVLDEKISELKKEIHDTRKDISRFEFRAEEITERSEHIQNLKKQLDELKIERQKMGVFKSKKVIDEKIKRAEKSYLQAENYFKHEYKISSEQAGAEVERLENRAKSLGNLRDKLQDKLTPLVAEQEGILKKMPPEHAERVNGHIEYEWDREHIQDFERWR